MLNPVQSRFRPCLSICVTPHHTQPAPNRREPCPTSGLRCFDKPDPGVCSQQPGRVVTQIRGTVRGFLPSHCSGAIGGFLNEPIMSNSVRLTALACTLRFCYKPGRIIPLLALFSVLSVLEFNGVLASAENYVTGPGREPPSTRMPSTQHSPPLVARKVLLLGAKCLS